MDKRSSKSQSKSWAGLLGRALKVLVVVLLIPLDVGLLLALLEQLDIQSLTGSATFRQWIGWGFTSYIGFHLLLYRPSAFFRASHRLFSALAVWLFGGQVSSVERDAGGNSKGKGAKGAAPPAGAQGSPLVAFSPYVVPLYEVLVCAAGWALRRWVSRGWIDGPVGVLIGVTMAFQWLMTAEDLQQQRERWHMETYLLAIGLVFLLTLLIGGACVPWVIPEFSFARGLGDGFARTQAIYTTILQRLFF